MKPHIMRDNEQNCYAGSCVKHNAKMHNEMSAFNADANKEKIMSSDRRRNTKKEGGIASRETNIEENESIICSSGEEVRVCSVRQ